MGNRTTRVHPTPTQKILTEKDLPDVLKALRDARGKWKEIGLVLGIPITDLNTIEMESDNKVDKCLENMITIWLKRRSLNPSWQSLIEALKEPTVGEEGVADDIEKKYVKAKEVDTTDDASQDSPPSPQHVPSTENPPNQPENISKAIQRLNTQMEEIEHKRRLYEADIQKQVDQLKTAVEQLSQDGVVPDKKNEEVFGQFHVTGNGSRFAIAGEQASFNLEFTKFSTLFESVSAKLVTDCGTDKCEVKRMDNGKYTYTPATRGRHQLHIKIGQTPIGCSPLPVLVTLPPQRLVKPVRVYENARKWLKVATDSKGRLIVLENEQIDQRQYKKSINIVSLVEEDIKYLPPIQCPKDSYDMCLDSDDNISQSR